MGSRVFALIIGIDMYKSGEIWNLESAVHDAKRVSRWLVNDIHVPRDHIALLLNNNATKQNIEDTFARHLINNDHIQRGDAILVYFAGHGSTMPAPRGWFRGTSVAAMGGPTVELLCTHDFDTKDANGQRITGISDRSMQALINDLACAKGNNITLILDSCFSPTQSRSNIRDRSFTRWTATSKAKPTDLITGLWPTAKSSSPSELTGFYSTKSSNHTTILACSPGEKAMEGKNGGRFTFEFLRAAKSVSLHHTTVEQLMDHVRERMAEGPQSPVVLGTGKSQIIFDSVPFAPDAIYLPVYEDANFLCIDAGLAQGIFKGDELTIHHHNYGQSHNPQIATVVVVEVHPTWSKCMITSPSKLKFKSLPPNSFARISRSTSRRIQIHLKQKYVSLLSRRKKQIPDRHTTTTMNENEPVLPADLGSSGSSDTLSSKLVLHTTNPQIEAIKAAYNYDDAAHAASARTPFGFRNLVLRFNRPNNANRAS